MGSFGATLRKFTNELGKLLTMADHIMQDHFLYSITICIQSGNCASILGTLLSADNVDEIFCL